jgi:hypothetical protein
MINTFRHIPNLPSLNIISVIFALEKALIYYGSKITINITTMRCREEKTAGETEGQKELGNECTRTLVHEWAVCRSPVACHFSFNLLKFTTIQLNLKINATFIVIWNLYASEGLVNGTETIIIGFQEHCRAAEVIGSRKTTLIPRIQLFPSDPTMSLKLC